MFTIIYMDGCFCPQKMSETAPTWLMEPFWLQEWSRFGCTQKKGCGFFLNMIIKEKRLHPPKWHRNLTKLNKDYILMSSAQQINFGIAPRLQVEAVLDPLFSQ